PDQSVGTNPSALDQAEQLLLRDRPKLLPRLSVIPIHLFLYFAFDAAADRAQDDFTPRKRKGFSRQSGTIRASCRLRVLGEEISQRTEIPSNSAEFQANW